MIQTAAYVEVINETTVRYYWKDQLTVLCSDVFHALCIPVTNSLYNATARRYLKEGEDYLVFDSLVRARTESYCLTALGVANIVAIKVLDKTKRFNSLEEAYGAGVDSNNPILQTLCKYKNFEDIPTVDNPVGNYGINKSKIVNGDMYIADLLEEVIRNQNTLMNIVRAYCSEAVIESLEAQMATSTADLAMLEIFRASPFTQKSREQREKLNHTFKVLTQRKESALKRLDIWTKKSAEVQKSVKAEEKSSHGSAN